MKRRVYILVLLIFCIAGTAFIVQNRLRSDRQAPEIRFPEEDITYQEGEDPTVLLQGVTAVDDRDGDVTASLMIEDVYLVEDGSYAKITYVAMDRSQNVGKAQRVIRCEASRAEIEEESTEAAEMETTAAELETTAAEPETSAAVVLPTPAEIRVAVINASGRNGTASEGKALLLAAGFVEVQAGSSSVILPVTTICGSQPEALELMLTYFPGAVTAEEMPEENVDIDLTDVDVCVLLGQE